MLLKRAADLVEALYGMPHSNQVKRGWGYSGGRGLSSVCAKLSEEFTTAPQRSLVLS